MRKRTCTSFISQKSTEKTAKPPKVERREEKREKVFFKRIYFISYSKL